MAKGKKGAKQDHLLMKDDAERQKIMQYLKELARDKIEKDLKNAKLNHLKIQTMWRSIMKEAKSTQLKSQLLQLQQTHERHLDQKNSLIKSLEKDILEAEEQYSTALQSHIVNVDTLIDLQMERLKMVKGLFETDKAELGIEFDSERAKLMVQHARERADLLGIMTRMEQDFQETEADAKHEYSSVKDDIKNKNLEEKHALRIQLEGTVEDLWRQFQSALNQYTSSTEERKKQFEDLKHKDLKNAREIELQLKKLVKLSEQISHLKAKLSFNSREYEDRNRLLREEKEAVGVHFQELKVKMNLYREGEMRKLTRLMVLSDRVIRELMGKVEKAEKILKLAEMNRKLETEEERVLPFYESSAGDDENLEIDKEITLPKEYSAMEQFHKRFNKVTLDKLALEKQRVSLKQENEHLRSILKQYLDGISVNEEVLRQLNPLMVVNGKTNAPLRHPQSVCNITYIEASQQMNAQRIAI
ncbi:Dynein regulatory complex subunit 2 [Nowakowskiella sp. JEL0407]|nr:Dynein regulatory complex subunit 2 [Nowakowskiella sp. JEL0407]